MRRELGLKYKRVRVVAPRANMLQPRVQRQRFALTLIEEMHAGKRIINVDESTME